MIRELTEEGYTIRLDLSGQVLRISTSDETDFDPATREVSFDPLFPQPSSEVLPDPLVRRPTVTPENVIHPTLRGLLDERFAPVSLLVQKAKQFDDGLYAAVERAAQSGAGLFAGKASLLTNLSARLAGRPDADEPLVLLVAAARLGGLSLELPSQLEDRVDRLTTDFLADEQRSKPLGFYTWTDDLEAIFRQDRLLQQEITSPPSLDALVYALRSAPPLRATYESWLGLVSRLTNPTARQDLRQRLAAGGSGGGSTSLCPPSVSHESELIKKLFADRPIPDGFSLVDEMIRRMRAGDLRVQPTTQSGWYDYQTWAHEPFVIPERMVEAAKLRFEEGYRNELLDLFKGAQALARETHIKQLERAIAMGMDVPSLREEPLIFSVTPDLTVEPLASFYLRRAIGYGFVRRVLEGVFGPEGLGTLSRLTPDGPLPGNLGGQLEEIESLFLGAYLITCREIALTPDESLPAEARGERHASRFSEWAVALDSDPDLGADNRMMIPVFYDLQRRKVKVWVFLGWAARDISVEFEMPPLAEVFDEAGQPVALGEDVQVAFNSEQHTVMYPVTAEVYVSRVLDREEFRQLCDAHTTRSAILAQLE